MLASDVAYKAGGYPAWVLQSDGRRSKRVGSPFVGSLKKDVARVILTVSGLFFDKLEQVLLNGL
jgi:hypothetical protein